MSMFSTSATSSWTSNVLNQDSAQADWASYQLVTRSSFNYEGVIVDSQAGTTTSTAFVASAGDLVVGDTLYFASSAGATKSLTLTATPGKVTAAPPNSFSVTGTLNGFGLMGTPVVSTDGTKMYALTNVDSTYYISQYSLSTPNSILTANYSNKRVTVPPTVNNIQFSPDGVYMYTFEYPNNRLNTTPYDAGSATWASLDLHTLITQYRLNTPWDVSTASIVTNQKKITAAGAPEPGYYSSGSYGQRRLGASNVLLTGNGTTLVVFISCSAANDADATSPYNYAAYSTTEVYTATLSTPWDISTAGNFSHAKRVLDVATSSSSTNTTYGVDYSYAVYPRHIAASMDGRTLIGSSYSQGAIRAHLNTAIQATSTWLDRALVVIPLSASLRYQTIPSLAMSQTTAQDVPLNPTTVETITTSADSRVIYSFTKQYNTSQTGSANHLYQIGISALGFASPPVKCFMTKSMPKVYGRMSPVVDASYFNSPVSLTRTSSTTTTFVGRGTTGLYSDNTVRLTTIPTTVLEGSSNVTVGSTVALPSASSSYQLADVNFMGNGSAVYLGAYQSGGEGVSTSVFSSNGITIATFGTGTNVLSHSNGFATRLQVSSDGFYFYLLKSAGSITNSGTSGGGRTLYGYFIGTAYDLSTYTADSTNIYTPTTNGFTSSTDAILDFFIDPTGTILYLANNRAIYQYTIATPWKLNTAVYANKTVDLLPRESSIRSFNIVNNGRTLLFVGDANDTIYRYDMSIAWDISTATNTGKFFDTGTYYRGGFDVTSNGSQIQVALASTSSTSGASYTPYTITTPPATVVEVTPTNVSENTVSPGGGTSTYTITVPTQSFTDYNLQLLPSTTRLLPEFVQPSIENVALTTDGSWAELYTPEVLATGRSFQFRLDGGKNHIVDQTQINLWTAS